MWPISNDQLHALLRHLPAVVYQDSHEPHPRTIYLSPNADTILGSGADEHLRDPDLWWRSIDPRDHDDLMRAWAQAYRTEQPYTVDYRYLRPDGRTVWLREHAAPVREQDRVLHWQGVLLDVTAERAAVDELVASEARYRSLIDHLPAAVYTLNADDPARVVYVSARMEDLFGYPSERWLEDPDVRTALLHPDDRERVLEGWADARQHGRPFETRYRIGHADGSDRWIVDHLHPIRGADGAIVAWEGMAFDVTREHETAVALWESETRHERLLQQIPGIAFSLLEGEERRFDYLSPRVQDILGYPRSLWFEEDGFWDEVVHPDDRDAVVTEWERCRQEEIPFRKEYRALHADGHVVWLRAETLPVRGPDGAIERWQGLWLDITETQVAREEQARSEARYQRLVEQAPAIVFTTDRDGAVQYVGPQVEQILGHPMQAWGDDPLLWESLLHPDDRAGVLDAWRQATTAERPYDAEYRVRRADGTYRWMHETTHPVRDADGAVTSWHGLTVDVHELHLARDAQEAAEARARVLLENVPAVVYEMGHDDERHTLYVSPHIERLLGYTRQEWLDQPDIWIELLHPDDRELELAAHDRHSSTGEPWSREYRLIAADGATVWVRDQATLVPDAEGRRSWQGVLIDVTSQRDTAELLELTNEELERLVRERTSALEEANALMGLEIAERRRAETDASRAWERYRVLVEHMPAVAYIWRTAAHAQQGPEAEADYYVSPRIEDVLGYTPEEWHDASCWIERLHPHDRDAVVAAMLRCEETGEAFAMEFRYFAKDGRVVWIEDHASLLSRTRDGKPALFHGVMLDVTVRKAAQTLAADAEERFRMLTETGPFVTYTLMADPTDPPSFEVEHVSPRVSTVVGYEASDWADRPRGWFDLVHPDDHDRVMGELLDQLRTGTFVRTDYRTIAADGRIVWLRDHRGCVEIDDSGRPRRFLGTIVDVTDEREERERTKEELATLRDVVERIPAVTWIESVIADGTGARYLYLSPQVEQLLGYTPEELLSERTHFLRMIHPDDEGRIDSGWRQACLSGAEVWEDRWRARHRDGAYRWIHARARRVSDPDARTIVWVGVSVDATIEMVGDPVVPGVGREPA